MYVSSGSCNNARILVRYDIQGINMYMYRSELLRAYYAGLDFERMAKLSYSMTILLLFSTNVRTHGRTWWNRTERLPIHTSTPYGTLLQDYFCRKRLLVYLPTLLVLLYIRTSAYTLRKIAHDLFYRDSNVDKVETNNYNVFIFIFIIIVVVISSGRDRRCGGT